MSNAMVARGDTRQIDVDPELKLGLSAFPPEPPGTEELGVVSPVN